MSNYKSLQRIFRTEYTCQNLFPTLCSPGRLTIVQMMAYENWDQTKTFHRKGHPFFCGWFNSYAERKELPESVIAKRLQGSLFFLFKKGEFLGALKLETHSVIAKLCKKNLKFDGVLDIVEYFCKIRFLVSTKASGDRKGCGLPIIAVCLLLVAPGLVMDQCSIAAALANTLAGVTNVRRAVELPPIPTQFPTLKDLTLPNYQKVVLPNGLRVFLLEDHELGLVGGEILVKGGSKDDPIGKVGLAEMSSIVQRSGGTTRHPPELLNSTLEEMAARIESSSSVSEMSVGFRCLSEDFSEVLSLFSEVVQHPLMPTDQLDLTRSQLLGSIKRRGDSPASIATREFSKLLYGDGSIYSRYFTESTLKSITKEDLLSFHKAAFSPSVSVLGIWGDFDKETVKDIIFRTFGGWNNHPDEDKRGLQGSPHPKLESGLSYSEPEVYVIDRPHLSQGFVRMGELGTNLRDPDVFALDVLNDILNGFGGLLFDQVRSKEGLAYSVYGGWTPAVEHRGSFLAGGETQVDTVAQFINSIKGVLESVTQSPPSQEMLDRAKEGIINSFVFNFVDSGAQLSRLMTHELFGIDEDFLFNYKKKVEALTPDEILEAAKRHLHPNSQPILIVTDVSRVKPMLQALNMEVVNIQPEYLLDK